jgi:hypothetical protein
MTLPAPARPGRAGWLSRRPVAATSVPAVWPSPPGVIRVPALPWASPSVGSFRKNDAGSDLGDDVPQLGLTESPEALHRFQPLVRPVQ